MARHSTYGGGYSGGGIPYGDAFLVQTPEIDQARQYMFQQQMQRRLLQQHEDAQLEQGMAQQFSKVREVDSPIVAQQWQNYKNISKQLLFSPQAQRDPQLYNQLSQAKTKALADIYTTINGSEQAKELQKQLMSAHTTHADVFSTDFGDRITKLQNTPINELQNTDLLNPDAYQFQHTLDFTAMQTKAQGTPKVLGYTKTETSPDNLQTATTFYKGGNNPLQYRDSLLMQLSKSPKGEREAAYMLHHFSPEMIDNINKEYYRDNQDKWNQTTGQPNPMNVEPQNPDSAAEQYASLQSKLAWIQQQPSIDKREVKQNVGAVMDKRFKNQEQILGQKQQFSKDMEKLKNNQSWAKLQWRESHKEDDEATKQQNTANAFTDDFEKAKQNQQQNFQLSSGENVSGFPVETYPIIRKEFVATGEAGHKVSPSQILISPDGSKYIGIYQTQDDKGNPVNFKKELSTQSLVPTLRNELYGKPKTALTGTQHPQTKPKTASGVIWKQ